MKRLVPHTLFAMALAALACEQPAMPTEMTVPDVLFAKGGGSKDEASRARYSFADQVDVGTADSPQWVPAGIRGDDRSRDGSPASGDPSNEYQGDFCGVNAVVGSGTGSQSADFNYDPDLRWTSSLPTTCQPARSYRVYMNGPAAEPGVTRPHQIVHSLATMAEGETRTQPLHSGTLDDLGVGLWFDDAYQPASNVRVTRLPDVPDPDGLPRLVRQWRVESQGTHRAMGMVQSTSKKGRVEIVPSGTTYYLPFAMTVTEVPYPYPTFP